MESFFSDGINDQKKQVYEYHKSTRIKHIEFIYCLCCANTGTHQSSIGNWSLNQAFEFVNFSFEAKEEDVKSVDHRMLLGSFSLRNVAIEINYSQY